jgi:putative FmdB family regulatory protein
MPIFEYICSHCRQQFETIVRSSREKINCPKCNSTAVVKQLSVFSSRASGSEAEAARGGGCGCTPQTCGCH